VKIHRFEKNSDGHIILIRNPFDAIISEFNRKNSKGHTGHAEREKFAGLVWENHVRQMANRWLTMYKTAIKYGNVHVLYFEDLKENLAENLIKTVKFLKKNNPELETRYFLFTLSQKLILSAASDRIKCIVHDSTGNFKRSKSDSNFFNPYSVAQKQNITEKIKKLQEVLLQNSLPVPPTSYLQNEYL